jgi:hypothetical protein
MNEVVKKIQKINFDGNVIPANWFRYIKYSNGKPNTTAIILLSEIIYWYKPVEIRDERTGHIIEYRQKFNGDKLQRSYQSFADQFGFTKRQVQEAIKHLVQMNLITVEFRTVTTNDGMKIPNVMFIEPIPEEIEKITFNIHDSKENDLETKNIPQYNAEHPTLKENISNIETGDIPHSNEGYPTLERRIYHIETEDTPHLNGGYITSERGISYANEENQGLWVSDDSEKTTAPILENKNCPEPEKMKNPETCLLSGIADSRSDFAKREKEPKREKNHLDYNNPLVRKILYLKELQKNNINNNITFTSYNNLKEYTPTLKNNTNKVTSCSENNKNNNNLKESVLTLNSNTNKVRSNTYNASDNNIKALLNNNISVLDSVNVTDIDALDTVDITDTNTLDSVDITDTEVSDTANTTNKQDITDKQDAIANNTTTDTDFSDFPKTKKTFRIWLDIPELNKSNTNDETDTTTQEVCLSKELTVNTMSDISDSKSATIEISKTSNKKTSGKTKKSSEQVKSDVEDLSIEAQDEAKKTQKKNGTKITSRKTTKTQQKNEAKVAVEKIFQHWISKAIIPHERLTKQAEKDLIKAMEVYSEEEIITAIDNYAYVLQHQEEFWWTYVYSFRNFIVKGLEQFLDFNVVKNNYSKKPKQQQQPKMTVQEKLKKFIETGDWNYLAPDDYKNSFEYKLREAVAKIEGKDISEVDVKPVLI